MALLTEVEVAERVGLSPRTLRHMRHTGGGPVFLKLGAAVRYQPADVDQWLADRPRYTRTHQPARPLRAVS